MSRNVLLSLYHTKFGHYFWNRLLFLLHKPFIWDKLVHSVDFWCFDKNEQCVCLQLLGQKIEKDVISDKKKILFIMPWYAKNATTRNVEQISDFFICNGYETHLFVYWEYSQFPQNINTHIWSRVFIQKSTNSHFGKTRGTKDKPDADHVDDWIDEGLLQTIRGLENTYHYNACVVNYLFFTKVFEVLPPEVRKITITHDVFTQRNLRLEKAGETPNNFWFSLATEKEEADALLRGNVVFGVQEEDSQYFRRITNNKTQVYTVPFLPPPNFLTRKINHNQEQLRVGYLASNNAPNILAIRKMIEEIKNQSNMHLYIGGTVCEKLEKDSLPPPVSLVGQIDSLESFYSEYDLYVNPDTFYSGLKCKTVEALSFGCPLICTKVASTGIGLEQAYHQFNDERECGAYLKMISNLSREEQVKYIINIQKTGELGFLKYEQTYSFERTLQRMNLSGAKAK